MTDNPPITAEMLEAINSTKHPGLAWLINETIRKRGRLADTDFIKAKNIRKEQEKTRQEEIHPPLVRTDAIKRQDTIEEAFKAFHNPDLLKP